MTGQFTSIPRATGCALAAHRSHSALQSDVSPGDLMKGLVCKVQWGCWGGKVPGVGRIGRSTGKQVGWSDTPGSSPHGITCFHVFDLFVKDKNGIWSGDLACLILLKNKP